MKREERVQVGLEKTETWAFWGLTGHQDLPVPLGGGNCLLCAAEALPSLLMGSRAL